MVNVRSNSIGVCQQHTRMFCRIATDSMYAGAEEKKTWRHIFTLFTTLANTIASMVRQWIHCLEWSFARYSSQCRLLSPASHAKQQGDIIIEIIMSINLIYSRNHSPHLTAPLMLHADQHTDISTFAFCMLYLARAARDLYACCHWFGACPMLNALMDTMDCALKARGRQREQRLTIATNS